MTTNDTTNNEKLPMDDERYRIYLDIVRPVLIKASGCEDLAGAVEHFRAERKSLAERFVAGLTFSDHVRLLWADARIEPGCIDFVLDHYTQDDEGNDAFSWLSEDSQELFELYYDQIRSMDDVFIDVYEVVLSICPTFVSYEGKLWALPEQRHEMSFAVGPDFNDRVRIEINRFGSGVRFVPDQLYNDPYMHEMQNRVTQMGEKAVRSEQAQRIIQERTS